MSEIAHNHPPRCCCHKYKTRADLDRGPVPHCPLCPEHGELAQLAQPQPGECPLCHSEIGKQHTDYCRFTGTVSIIPSPDGPRLEIHTQTSQPATQTSTPTTHARTELDRATLDATLTGNGYLLNGRRIPPEDVTIVHRDPTARDVTDWPTPDVTGDTHTSTLNVAHNPHPVSDCHPALCGREPTPTAQDTPSHDHKAADWKTCPLCNPGGGHTHVAR